MSPTSSSSRSSSVTIPTVAPLSSRTTARCDRPRIIVKRKSLHGIPSVAKVTGRKGGRMSPSISSREKACSIPFTSSSDSPYIGTREYRDCATCRATSIAGVATLSAKTSLRGVITSRSVFSPNCTTPSMMAISVCSPTPSSSPSRSNSSSASASVCCCSDASRRDSPVSVRASSRSGMKTNSATRSSGRSTGMRTLDQRRATARGTSCPSRSKASA